MPVAGLPSVGQSRRLLLLPRCVPNAPMRLLSVSSVKGGRATVRLDGNQVPHAKPISLTYDPVSGRKRCTTFGGSQLVVPASEPPLPPFGPSAKELPSVPSALTLRQMMPIESIQLPQRPLKPTSTPSAPQSRL